MSSRRLSPGSSSRQFPTIRSWGPRAAGLEPAGRWIAGTRPAMTSCLVFPEHLLAALVALLGFEREGGDRAGVEPLQADRLAGLLAKAVAALLDARERSIDLGDQLALAVAGSQLQCPIGLGGGAIGEVGMLRGVLVQDVP